MLNHPAGGISLGGKGLLVAFLCKEGSLKLAEGLGAAVVVIGQSEPERCREQDGPAA